ncbi:hypothetical protein QZM22_07780 [Burkholderia oklahomensis]|uniref:hypothetical protein n=1 Tax=Burkholderia oklahomensis TaxID=342113 RepID=UPI0026565705|nr:hypothetical protein [Burkholderia oklahomensis]MDN7672420.1 hypothetical protein [Burkholderia oklahomensis]
MIETSAIASGTVDEWRRRVVTRCYRPPTGRSIERAVRLRGTRVMQSTFNWVDGRRAPRACGKRPSAGRRAPFSAEPGTFGERAAIVAGENVCVPPTSGAAGAIDKSLCGGQITHCTDAIARGAYPAHCDRSINRIASTRVFT